MQNNRTRDLGGAPGPGRYPRRPWIFVFPGRPSYGRPGHSTVGRLKFGLHRLPLEFLSWSRWLHPPLRGFLRSGGARWMPIYTCYLSIGRDTHTLTHTFTETVAHGRRMVQRLLHRARVTEGTIRIPHWARLSKVTPLALALGCGKDGLWGWVPVTKLKIDV